MLDCHKAQEDKTLRIKDTSGLHLNRVRPSHSFTPPSPPPLSSSLSSSHLPSLPPSHLPSLPPSLLPSLPPPSLLPLRKFDSVLSSLFGMRLALPILRPHSHSHFHSHSHSHCLSLSLSLSSLSSLPHLFLISLSSLSLSSLSLSPLCLSSFRLSSLSSLAGGSGQRATYKGLFTGNRLPRPTCARRPAFCYSPQTSDSPLCRWIFAMPPRRLLDCLQKERRVFSYLAALHFPILER